MSLTLWSVLLGLGLVAVHVPLVAAPAWVRRVAVAFPRTPWCGWILAAADLAWAAWLLHDVPLGRFEGMKAYLPLLTPAVFVVVAVFVDELLAARALGGLLVLVPAPLLDAARWNPSAWRLVVVVIAYVMAVEGMALLLSPYWFRKTVQSLLALDGLRRALAWAGCLVGVGLIVLGLAVY